MNKTLHVTSGHSAVEKDRWLRVTCAAPEDLMQVNGEWFILDGYDGMEGNGPVGGTPVDHRVAVASLDWLAADRVGVALMGIDHRNVGYLNFCGQAGLGQWDLSKIEVVVPPLADHVKKYQLNQNIEQQLVWMKPAQPA